MSNVLVSVPVPVTSKVPVPLPVVPEEPVPVSVTGSIRKVPVTVPVRLNRHSRCWCRCRY